LTSINKVKIICLRPIIGAFPFLKKERAGLFASIFSKKKRIFATIPYAMIKMKEKHPASI